MSFFLLLQPFYSLSQCSGTYRIGGGFFGTSITLLPQNKFVYHFGDCTSSLAGEGWYKLKRTLLILHFEKDTMCIDQSIVDSIVLPSKDPKFSNLDVLILDKKNKTPLIQGQSLIRVESCLNDKYHSTGRGTITDENGHAILQLPLQDTEGYLRISGLGYKAVIIPFCLAKDYNIKVQLTDWCKSVPAGKIYKFKIKRTKEDFELVTRKGERFYKEK